MLSSYGETSGFTLVSNEELALVNGGKGSSSSGSKSGSKNSSSGGKSKSSSGSGGKKNKIPQVPPPQVTGVGGVDNTPSAPSIQLGKNVSITTSGLQIQGENGVATFSGKINSVKPPSFTFTFNYSF